jgi:FkbM family methyltransferase
MNILQIGTCDGGDHVFDFCQENKELLDIPHCEFIEKAVVVDDVEEIEIFIPTEQTDDISQHASTRKEHVLALEHDEARSVNVAATRINKLLELFSDGVDRLYIDTEGLDADIIMDIDFTKFSIPYIQFEYVHNDGTYIVGPKLSKVTEMLLSFGYDVKESGYDFICTFRK